MVTSDTREEIVPDIGSYERDTQDSYATQEGHGSIENEGQSSSDESSLLGNASWSDE